jgi:hypothetical protein
LLLEVVMRRVLTAATVAAALVLVASPAQAFAHMAVTNPYLHAVLDVLTLAVAGAPLWTALLWGPQQRLALLALIAVVQLPVAVIGFLPVLSPTMHLTADVAALGLTAASLWVVRRTTRSAPAPAPASASR